MRRLLHRGSQCRGDGERLLVSFVPSGEIDVGRGSNGERDHHPVGPVAHGRTPRSTHPGARVERLHLRPGWGPVAGGTESDRDVGRVQHAGKPSASGHATRRGPRAGGQVVPATLQGVGVSLLRWRRRHLQLACASELSSLRRVRGDAHRPGADPSGAAHRDHCGAELFAVRNPQQHPHSEDVVRHRRGHLYHKCGEPCRAARHERVEAGRCDDLLRSVLAL
mmetsp:Transcript_65300/g.173148  ORF Transcript_65300/g.173148 Transcript_65300/m.173148 type:complete len:222 (+) Transcript_65300:3935-4600(+)